MNLHLHAHMWSRLAHTSTNMMRNASPGACSSGVEGKEIPPAINGTSLDDLSGKGTLGKDGEDIVLQKKT